MWIFYALTSAFFAGITSILAKIGIKGVNTNLATAIRTAVVFLFACWVASIGNAHINFTEIPIKVWMFLALSGISTGLSWICYFKALDLGSIQQVAPIDKFGTVLTILLAFLILGEELTVWKAVSILLISMGTFLMLKRYERRDKTEISALILAFLSAIFASFTSIFAKIGIVGVESNVGTAIRTFFVLLMAWGIVFCKGEWKEIKKVDMKNILFLVLSGFATGASWLLYYKAMQTGDVSIIAPIDKLSIVVTMVFSYILLKEKVTKHFILGLICLMIGIMALLL